MENENTTLNALETSTEVAMPEGNDILSNLDVNDEAMRTRFDDGYALGFKRGAGLVTALFSLAMAGYRIYKAVKKHKEEKNEMPAGGPAEINGEFNEEEVKEEEPVEETPKKKKK
jgi:hypothetical protein